MINLPVEIRVCPYCGKSFSIRGYEITKSPPRKFCSRECKHRGLAIHAKTRQMSSEETAWLAGVIDGEGWINWPRREDLGTFRVGIASTSLPLIERIAEVTGTGSIKPRKPQNPKHSPSWVWYAYSSNVTVILKACLPWLIVKREFAEVALGIRKVDHAPATARGLAQRQPSRAA